VIAGPGITVIAIPVIMKFLNVVRTQSWMKRKLRLVARQPRARGHGGLEETKEEKVQKAVEEEHHSLI